MLRVWLGQRATMATGGGNLGKRSWFFPERFSSLSPSAISDKASSMTVLEPYSWSPNFIPAAAKEAEKRKDLMPGTLQRRWVVERLIKVRGKNLPVKLHKEGASVWNSVSSTASGSSLNPEYVKESPEHIRVWNWETCTYSSETLIRNICKEVQIYSPWANTCVWARTCH